MTYKVGSFLGLSGEPRDLLHYIQEELERIEVDLGGRLPSTIVYRYAAPPKVFEGLIVGADGTNWNPGSGKGIYHYHTGSWHFLG